MEFVTIAIVSAIGFLLLIRMGRLRTIGSLPNSRFVELTSVQELDDMFRASRDRPCLLFLFDPSCPISAVATRQIAKVNREVVAIDVSRRHDLSREIETRTGVQHESPQAIVIDCGVAIWDASHAAITTRTIDAVMSDIEGARSMSDDDRHRSHVGGV